MNPRCAVGVLLGWSKTCDNIGLFISIPRSQHAGQCGSGGVGAGRNFLFVEQSGADRYQPDATVQNLVAHYFDRSGRELVFYP